MTTYNDNVLYDEITVQQTDELYLLSWTPSVSKRATHQSVFAELNGMELVLVAGSLVMSTDYVEFRVRTGSSVIWYVRTYDGEEYVDSTTDSFIA